MCLPSLAENDSRLLKNRKGKSRWWVDLLSKEGGRCCFILASHKNEKDHKNLQSKLNWSIIARKRTITKQWTLKCETNKTDQNSPITNHKPWLFELVQVNMCFLRGLLRWLMEQKNAKYAKCTARFNEFCYNMLINIEWMYMVVVNFLSRVIFIFPLFQLHEHTLPYPKTYLSIFLKTQEWRVPSNMNMGTWRNTTPFTFPTKINNSEKVDQSHGLFFSLFGSIFFR